MTPIWLPVVNLPPRSCNPPRSTAVASKCTLLSPNWLLHHKLCSFSNQTTFSFWQISLDNPAVWAAVDVKRQEYPWANNRLRKTEEFAQSISSMRATAPLKISSIFWATLCRRGSMSPTSLLQDLLQGVTSEGWGPILQCFLLVPFKTFCS